LIEKVFSKYIVINPSDSVWSALIFGHKVRLGGAGIRDAIQYSVITNSLQDFTEVQEFVPETSLIMLRVAANGTYIANGIDSVINSIAKTEVKGDLWETAYYEWMKIRVEFASRYYGEHISIMKLLGIETVKIVPVQYRELFHAPLQLYGALIGEKGPLSCRSNNANRARNQVVSNIDKVRNEIDAVKVSKSCPIIIVRPAIGESWDLCLKIFTGEGEKPMHILIENKSIGGTPEISVEGLATWKTRRAQRDSHGTSEENDSVTSYDLHRGGHQYRHTKEMMGERDFVYAYFTTHSMESFTVEKAIELGRTDSFRYLGPLCELYRVGRSISS
jgi:hypothetical protein